MVDFEIVEADFQQYYHLDLEEALARGFRRSARLLINLPMESRFIMSKLDSKDWTWDKEVQSRILSSLEIISCQLSNMFRKKGKKKVKPGEQFQPDYVKKAKENAIRAKNMKRKITKEEMDNIKAFWKNRNPDVKLFEVQNGKS